MAGAAAASLAPSTMLASCAPKKDEKKGANTPLNLCFQEGIALGETLQEKLDYCESLGVTGFEVGGRGLAGRVDEINNALKGRNVRMAAICAGFDGFILAEDGQKDEFDRTMREIIEAAGKINSCGVIMVPAFNGQQPCRPHTMDTRNYLCEQLHELGEFALQCGTTVILEPLNRGECFYMRLVADAAAIIAMVSVPSRNLAIKVSSASNAAAKATQRQSCLQQLSCFASNGTKHKGSPFKQKILIPLVKNINILSKEG